jgi:ABC-type lipoprotein export system ATPase subunit
MVQPDTGTPHQALTISALRFAYPGAGSDTVNVGSFSLGTGEQALLTGGSGTGKSTLLHLIAGLLEPTSGRIDVAGRNIHALAGTQRDLFRGRSIGMIFQTFNLLQGFSALENVLAALMFSSTPAKEQRDRALALLARLGIEQVHQEATRLSVGQQQRVAVARALACGPALVLADEPTASLDPENARAAMDLIQGACADAKAALLCVSHDPSIADRFSRREALKDLRGALVGEPAR